jgi:hypothetical protein
MASTAKAKAETDNVALCSMDDAALYGKELYVITFSEAVQRGLLCDYKVLVLSVEESMSAAACRILLERRKQPAQGGRCRQDCRLLARAGQARHTGRPEPRSRPHAPRRGVLSGH